ncbi:type ISP restriction/modification enzyme [Microbacterium testaceum]|uniref:type ISP restriction/modification enzyme n=1 Tax=Microbacterium testaceum TaxID=2033 RepID=UPI0022E1CCD8|nr:type ISP restriction/modification enzyme [Microbacterium testaceum]
MRLLQSGLIKPHDLARKYRYELHANEIVLLAYYVAAINIEETYHALRGGEYVPFDGIVLTDTFQMFEDDDELDDMGIFQANNDRVVAQKERDIRVIIGNPPYSAGQKSGNDDNANNSYATLDSKIRETYAKRSSATGKLSLYDSYIRAIRWASDRIGDEGIVAYVSNGGYIDSNSADGVRLSLLDEFTSVYIFNLRGNTRNSGEKARQEGGQIFGSGSRATIAIALFVKNPARQTPSNLYYHDIGDYLDRRAKLDTIRSFGSVAEVPWREIEPSTEGDWTARRNEGFARFTPVGSKEKSSLRVAKVFTTYSSGIKTNRDTWAYNFSLPALTANVTDMVAEYARQLDAAQRADERGEEYIREIATERIKWDGVLEAHPGKRSELEFSSTWLRTATYRPFAKMNVATARTFNNSIYQIPSIFPRTGEPNLGFYIVGMGSAVPFSVLMIDQIPDVHVTGAGSGGQFFPRYTYRAVEQDPSTLFSEEGTLGTFDEIDEKLTAPTTPGVERVDNITNGILTDYRQSFDKGVTKDDIFFYVYGLLHSREYRAEFEADLTRMLPRIPKVKTFKQFVRAGRALSELHLNYETVEPYPLIEKIMPNASLRVTKMRYAKEGRRDNKTTIIYNDHITLTGIPEEAQEYLLGSRSALDWIIERYQVKTDKASGIVNDPNAWGDEHGDPRYILDLIKRITTVSVETVKIVEGLPPLEVVDA